MLSSITFDWIIRNWDASSQRLHTGIENFNKKKTEEEMEIMINDYVINL